MHKSLRVEYPQSSLSTEESAGILYLGGTREWINGFGATGRTGGIDSSLTRKLIEKRFLVYYLRLTFARNVLSPLTLLCFNYLLRSVVCFVETI